MLTLLLIWITAVDSYSVPIRYSAGAATSTQHPLNSRQPSHRISYVAGHSVSQPHFQSYPHSKSPQFQYHPTYHQPQPPSSYEPEISYTPPPFEHYHHQPASPSKPILLSQYNSYANSKPYMPSNYNSFVNTKPHILSQSSPHSHDFLDFPMFPHKGGHSHNFLDFPLSSHKGSTPTSFYNYLFPLALLGISIPALGLMYTYLSRRRRRRDLTSEFDNYFRPKAEDLERYLVMLQKSIHRFQENTQS